jgi:hypothetical protein
VSCTSPTACVAVGSSSSSTGPETPLAEAWNGVRWRIQPTPSPSGSYGASFFAVSCTVAHECVAVGSNHYIVNASANLAEIRTGGVWSIQTTPDPAGFRSSELAGVSCTSAKNCISVGYSSPTDGVDSTVAEGWNGSSWILQTSQDKGAGSLLSSVSCTTVTVTACTAVGIFAAAASNRDRPLAETWDGKVWATQTVPNPAGGRGSVLNGVSCTSQAACLAFGTSEGHNYIFSAFADEEGGD